MVTVRLEEGILYATVVGEAVAIQHWFGFSQKDL